MSTSYTGYHRRNSTNTSKCSRDIFPWSHIFTTYRFYK
nr:MAG TPA: hypothetical protein [Crassvirales sp.]